MLNIRALAIGAFVVPVRAQPSLAQNYPSQNVTVIVAFPAGGLADIIGRLVSTKLEGRLKQSVVVENRGGAGGNIAAKAVAGAAPDGYTLLATTSGLAANMTASKNRASSKSDLRPIAFVAISPDVIAIHPSNPAKNLKEFIANAKDKSFTYGSAGAGTGPQIGAEYFFQEVAKVKYVHVPFQGGAPAITATLGNHVDALVLTLPPVTPHIRSGALRGIGVASDKRNSAIPDVPTYGEMGYPECLFRFVGRLLRAGQDARRRRGKAQRRDQRADEGTGLARQARQGGLRSGGEERRRGQRLLQERGRELGQDGQRHRLLELTLRGHGMRATAMNAARKPCASLSDLDAAGLTPPTSAPRWKRSPRNMPSPSRRRWRS